MEYKIIFSKRRTVALMVNRDGQVVVRAPKRVSVKFIGGLINKKRDWIKKAIEHHLSHLKTTQFAEGEMFLYLGQQFPLHISNDYRRRLVFEDKVFYISRFKLGQAKKLFEVWYKRQAQIILAERVKYYVGQMGVGFNKMTIKSSMTRWGSCSSAKNINFSYRLIMAPMEIIDYVVIHELAHLKHQNHSAGFWQFVSQFYPTYSQARKWLRQHGHLLKI